MEFAAWLSNSGIKDFSQKSPEECIMLLDKLASSGEEGEDAVKTLFAKFQNQKKPSAISSKADYLTTLKAGKGTKVGRKPGDYIGAIRHNDRWNLVRDEHDADNHIQEIENSYGDRIRLTTGIAGDSTLQALPVKRYDSSRQGAGVNPYVLNYDTPEYKNAAAWTTRSGLEKVLDAIVMKKFSLPEWKDASDKYAPYFKNPHNKVK